MILPVVRGASSHVHCASHIWLASPPETQTQPSTPMKTPMIHRSPLAPLTLVLLFLAANAGAQDVTASNLTVQQAALFGTIYTDPYATTTAEALRIDTDQGFADVYRTSTTPGYYQDELVTVEDYGWVDNGYWEYTTQYELVGYDTIPATYDEEGNEITPESQVERWDYVTRATNWVYSPMWAVVGSHQETQQVWMPEQTNTWVETTNGGTPRVRFNGTRSDTNFAFRVPSPTSPDGMKDILVLWEGGMTLPGTDPARSIALTGDSLQQGWVHSTGNGSTEQTTSALRAESLTHTTNASRTTNGVQHFDKSENESRPESIRLTRTETVNGTSTVAQTQIAAKSATFAGVVVVGGDVNVGGVIRVRPAGDLSMGAYTSGPQP